MLDYRQELERRISQFAGYLKKMHHRSHEEVHGSCFIIFQERPPANDFGTAVLSEALKPALEVLVAGFDDAGNGGVFHRSSRDGRWIGEEFYSARLI
jgi:hypothetical protein